MSAPRTLVAVMAALIVGASALPASAQVFGTFSWQMQPYCNQITLTLTSVTGNFTLDGSDDQCGAAKKGSATGIGVFNPDGTVGLNFTIVASPGGSPVHVSASVNPANGQGTWTDSVGNGGTFAFFGANAGLPPRPTGQVYFRTVGHQLAPGPGGAVLWFVVTQNDGGGTYNAATGYYTVPETGLYSISYSLGWAPGPTTSGRACAFISSTFSGTDRSSCAPIVGGSSFLTLSGTTVIPLQAGNTVRVETNESSTDALSMATSSGVGLVVAKIR